MDLNFYDNDFEDFLKQKSDQYKMYPSDRVWNNVYSSLHGRKKWWALGFMLFFIAAGALVGNYFIQADYDRVAAHLNDTAAGTLTDKTSTGNASLPHFISAPAGTATAARGAHSVTSIGIQKDIYKNRTGFRNVLPQIQQQEVIAANTKALPARGNETALFIENELLPSLPSANTFEKAGSITVSPLGAADRLPVTAVKKILRAAVVRPDEPAAVDAAATAGEKPSRFSIKLSASPTVSYRRLSSLDQQAASIPFAAGYAGDINRYVRHKPAPGFELGTSIQYKLSNNLTLFAGAQLNYSRYYIDAFKYRTEKASIALDKAQVRDTLSGYTDIRNFSGYAPEQLQNKYLQLSIPVGMEIKLLGHKKVQFSVAGSVQPTFLLTSTSYLLSSDYKNYIQSPDLARTFNVHTNFEAILSYQTAGGLKWQVGPQFRSQLLSSYSNQYRVREYLTEYGIKIGVIKTFR